MYKYPDELIEEIRLNNDIVDVVSEYVRLEKKSGKYLFGLCPFHKEKTPSFSVTPSMQIFRCFGCGKAGNVFRFIMDIENLGYIDAIKYLAERANIRLPEGNDEEEIQKAALRKAIIDINTEAARFFYQNLKGHEQAQQYLYKRGLSTRTIKSFGLGYADEAWDTLYKHLKEKGFDNTTLAKSGLFKVNKSGGLYDTFRERIMFPIFDLRNNIIAFGGRVMDDSHPKYMNSPETIAYNKSRNLYALNFAKKTTEKRIIVVEGYMDVISLHQWGIINTVASLGTALTESQGRLLKKYAEEIIISYDADSAGQAATVRGLDLLNELGCNVKVLLIPDGKDPDEFIRKNGSDAFRKLADSAISLIEYKMRILRKQIDTGSTDGKILFMNKMAEVLSKVDNLVEREMYVRKMAAEYRVSEDAIFAEIQKRTQPRQPLRTSTTHNTPGGVRPAAIDTDIGNIVVHDERMLLILLTIDNSVYSLVKEKFSIEDFLDDSNRNLAALLYDRLEDAKGIVPAELMNMVDTTVAHEFVKILQDECNFDDNKKAVMDITKRLVLNRLDMRQQKILEMLGSQEDKTERDVEKLKQELSAIIIKKRTL